MTNITLDIDDQVLERARRLASERGVSVEQMVRDLLASATATETDDARRAREEMGEMARNSRYGMAGPWNREEAYAERLSRYERPDLRGDRADDAGGEVAKGGGDRGGD